MTATDVQTTRPAPATPRPIRSTTPEPGDVVIVDDVDALTAGAAPGCGDDNPYA